MSQSILAFNEAASPSVFNFGTHAVRIIVRDGQPWFVANDVCAALDYANTSKAIADHLDDDERSTITNSESRNGGGRLTIINESGLYALVLRSRKPEARKFAKWVTGEVLPSIRKTGSYTTDSERVALAESLAIEAVTGIYRSVFNAVMNAGPDWRHYRYLVTLGYDAIAKTQTKPHARALSFDKMVVSMDELPDWINGPDPVSSTDVQLARVAMACAKKQESRAQRRAEREALQRQTMLTA